MPEPRCDEVATVATARPPGAREREVARALDTAHRATHGHEALNAATIADLENPSPASVSVVAFDPDDRPLGLAHMAPHDTLQAPRLAGSIVLASDAGPVVAHRLLDGLVTACADAGGGRIVVWTQGTDDDVDRAAMADGFTREREQLQMTVALPIDESPRWPIGVTVRAFVPDLDDDAWLAVNNRAFANHPDQGSWVADTLARRRREPWFDPAGFLLAFDARGLAGFCWTKVHQHAVLGDTPDPVGEIFVIGVDPDHQGGGLGRALVVGGLDHLVRVRGCPTGMLYLAARNTAALALYRSLGFHVRRTDRAYAIEVAADRRARS